MSEPPGQGLVPGSQVGVEAQGNQGGSERAFGAHPTGRRLAGLPTALLTHNSMLERMKRASGTRPISALRALTTEYPW